MDDKISATYLPLGSWGRKNNRNAIAAWFHSAFWKKSLSLQVKFAVVSTSSLFAVASGIIGNIAKSRIWFVTFAAAFQQIFDMTRCIAVPGLIHENDRRTFRHRVASEFWNLPAWNVQSSASCVCRVRAEKKCILKLFTGYFVLYYSCKLCSFFYVLICFIKCLLMNNKKHVIKTICSMVAASFFSQLQTLNQLLVCCCTQSCLVSRTFFWNVHLVLAGVFGWIWIVLLLEETLP